MGLKINLWSSNRRRETNTRSRVGGGIISFFLDIIKKVITYILVIGIIISIIYYINPNIFHTILRFM